MTANRRRARRTAVIATTVAGVALTAGLVTGCDPDSIDNSLNCLQNADTISDSLKAIHEAGLDAAKDPTRTEESIDTIEKNLDKIDDKDKTDNDKAILNGDTTPDSSKIDAAVGALKNVCTS
ncbi:hypothetical protein G5C60_28535 [Streptomyces sp. HC44]|uniref:Secreted protein n=1 Tax=Streptomyces scabichelini TaxID=2711217 RepID=A0A6G4VC17_9ACTN|nr:hypothetical protein [Streptomyces scabichelini]NGO11445.1 hypothetical protein [Streptomyces scabichelini]